MAHSKPFWLYPISLLAALVVCGCENGSKSAPSNVGQTTADSAGDQDRQQPAAPGDTSAAQSDEVASELAEGDPANEEPIGPLETYEVVPDDLLAAALPSEELEEGWIRLFDGQSLFGWFVVGKADWRIEDGILRVTRGERSYLCTSFQLADYELEVEFRADKRTNSGVFLRAVPSPENVADDCLELNIAPPDNPFPTGSFVQRQQLSAEDLAAALDAEFDPTEWHTYSVRLEGSSVQVSLDGKQIMELDDFRSSPTGHISLQHNEGRVEFRNIKLKPLASRPLKLDSDWETDWTKSEKEGASLAVTPEDDGLKLVGGLGQLQSNADFGNFVLQASYTLAKPEVNSGIFFRCIRDNMLDGYECQVNHATLDDDPLRPGDAGAGAIFRRQPARIVMGDGTQQSYVTILANGPQFVTWVNGVQVADFYDSRPPDENPRRGLRTDPGPISIQGHDPETEVVFHSMRIREL